MTSADDPTRDELNSRPTGTAEDEFLAFLHDAGLPQPKDLDDETRQRTDDAALDALARITSSPAPSQKASRGRRESVASERPRSSHHRGRARRILRRQWLTATMPIASAIVIWALIVTSSDRAPSSTAPPQTPPPAAAATPPLGDFTLVSGQGRSLSGIPAGRYLTRLGNLAQEQQQQTTGPVQHTRLDGWFYDQSSFTRDLIPTITDRYLFADGDMRSLESVGAALGPGGLLSNESKARPRSDETFPGPEQGPDYAQSLPENPAALTKSLVPNPRECPSLTECLVSQLTQLHQTWVVPPEVTAAGWEALADRSDVEFLGDSADRLGRPAWAFATQTSETGRLTVTYVSPSTGQYLGSEEILERAPVGDSAFSDLSFPAVIGFTTLGASERVRPSDLPK